MKSRFEPIEFLSNIADQSEEVVFHVHDIVLQRDDIQFFAEKNDFIVQMQQFRFDRRQSLIEILEDILINDRHPSSLHLIEHEGCLDLFEVEQTLGQW